MKQNTKQRAKFSFGIHMLLILSVVFGIIFTSCVGFDEYKRRVADIRITMADFKDIPVGTYYGEYDAVWVAAKIQVLVDPVGVVKSIELIEHKNDRGSQAESIVLDIVSEQTLLLDSVSGATNSCKVIQKAVQNALESAKVL